MYPKLQSYIDDLDDLVNEMPDQRKQKLAKIADYIRPKGQPKLTFICTHNSRRSHLCEIWAAVIADHVGIDNLETYSGGTAATAFNPRAVAVIERAGFDVENPGGENPRYKVSYDNEKESLICFSKTFDDGYNPQKEFAAVMTCSNADENCPVVPGAEQRFSIPYVDPKEFDSTPREKETYDERCLQIASEMYYMMSQV